MAIVQISKQLFPKAYLTLPYPPYVRRQFIKQHRFLHGIHIGITVCPRLRFLLAEPQLFIKILPILLLDFSNPNKSSCVTIYAYRSSYECLSLFLQDRIPYPSSFPELEKRKLPLESLTPLPDNLRHVPELFDGEYPCTIYETDCKELYFLNKKLGWTHLLARPPLYNG